MGNALMPVAVKERFANNPLRATSVYTVGIQLGAAAAAALAVPLANLGSGRERLAHPARGLQHRLAGLPRGLAARCSARAAARRAPPARRRVAAAAVAQHGRVVALRDLPADHDPVLRPRRVAARRAGGGRLERVRRPAPRSRVLNATTVVATIFVGTLGTRAASRRALMVPATAFLRRRHPRHRRRTPTAAWLWAVACGAGIGTLFPTMMTLPIDVADRPEAVGAVAGLMLLVGYVGAAPPPSLLGRAARLDRLVQRHDVGAVRRRGHRAGRRVAALARAHGPRRSVMRNAYRIA